MEGQWGSLAIRAEKASWWLVMSIKEMPLGVGGRDRRVSPTTPESCSYAPGKGELEWSEKMVAGEEPSWDWPVTGGQLSSHTMEERSYWSGCICTI